MKKVLVAILIILYAASSSGATIHFHYCMGKLVETGFKVNNTRKCGKCGMPKKDLGSCCTDIQKFVKVAQSHEKSVFDYKTVLLWSIPIFNGISFVIPVTKPIAIASLEHRPPPSLLTSVPLFLRYRNFRI